ncbi:MAG: spermidine synthase [Planctomycetaceae bacterium]
MLHRIRMLSAVGLWTQLRLTLENPLWISPSHWISHGCSGLWLGMYCTLWGEQFCATFSRSPFWITAAIGGILCGLLLAAGISTGWHFSGTSRREDDSRPAKRSWLNSGICHLGWAFWTVFLPLLGQCLLDLVGLIPIEHLERSFTSGMFIGVSGIVCWMFPAFLAGRELWNRATAGDNNKDRERTIQGVCSIWLTGLASGIALMAVVIGPAWGVTVGTVGLLIGSAIVFLRSLLQGGNATSSESALVAVPLGQGRPVGWLRSLQVVAWGASMGALFPLVQRMTIQWFSASSYLEAMMWAGLLMGVACALWLRQRLMASSSFQNVSIALISVCVLSLACLLCGFGWGIDLNLWINARVSQFWIVMLLRSLEAAGPMLIIGLSCALGLYVVRPRLSAVNAEHAASMNEPASVNFLTLSVCGGLGWGLGFSAMNLWGIENGNPPLFLALLLCVACGLLGVWSWQAFERRSRRSSIVAMGTICLTLVMCLIGRQSDDAMRSAKVLFSTNVFAAYNHRWDRSLLPYLDEARCIDKREGLFGTQTVWTYLGAQCQFRENGIPRGVISVNPRVSPDYSGEILSAVAPLVLHDKPHRVMVLGLGGGTPLRTVMDFPVQEIVCCEPDRSLIEIQDEVIAPRIGSSIFDDDRLQWRHLDVIVGLSASDLPYDVIVSNPHVSSLSHSTAEFTREYYGRVFDRLAVDGIFCQRFQQADYGARPLCMLCGTMRDVFPEVMAIESGPSEILLIATKAPGQLLREGLVERLQTPQVRRRLAHVGWDWSILLNLNTLMPKQVDELIAESRLPVNSVQSLCFANELPREVIRWGEKLKEVQQLTSGKAGHLLKELGEDDQTPELLNRLSDVAARNRLMTEFPDQYWVYRKTVRQLVTSRPRSLIQPVSTDGEFSGLHPEDRRRLDYFSALGKAAGQKSPDPKLLSHIGSFSQPYDPLLSYFVHQEVAELYAKSAARGSPEECEHRLHAIHFGFPSDRSVRNIADALQMIAQHPQSIADPWGRWDSMNGLLQMLKIHWDNRGQSSPETTKIAINDIDQSLLAIDQTFAGMERLHTELGISTDAWNARKMVVEKGLVRPLRTYRSRLMPLHFKEQQKLNRLMKSSAENSTSEPQGDRPEEKTRLTPALDGLLQP